MLDHATNTRTGEELNQEKLSAYLQDNLADFQNIQEIKQFPGGYSNLTYLLSTNVGNFVLRRPPFGANVKGGHDMGREFKVLSLLKPVYAAVPAPILHCTDLEIMGAEFYMMERVEGVILRQKPPKDIDLSPEIMQKISEAAIDNLVTLHSLDIEKTGLQQLGKPEGYVQRQVEGWIGRYFKAETDTVQTMNELADWLPKNYPPEQKASFLHNDYKYDNLVLDASYWELGTKSEGLGLNIKAVLDWEMATVGDPLMDLGLSLAYWLEAHEAQSLAVTNLTWLAGNLTRQGVLERYAQKSGRNVDNILFYYVFGLFKLAVIVQQIYARYKKGLTQDPRFAPLGAVVVELAKKGLRAVDENKI